ncbi:GPW/gp25 family protein [Hymenobacter convexus]|uniref:GPW/gp25 family protein n=1 Tax=Hymenobacter sp. CA1UV-4 TaxID=3063782 RepID=UPI0027125B89|nr:GPW/gp25 family protein [Hymenobacter sp. CA1UV-4]MDO7854086.1 GPW/gp25 family protein [Hymenobacter sp. CA1UV-4]
MEPDDAFLGRGWGFPPRFFASGAEVEMVAGPDDIRESLHVLLHTALGERPMAASYGCDLLQFMFEEVDQHLMTGLREVISQAILLHESRIVLDGVEVQRSRTDAGLLLVDIAYTVRAVNSRFNFVYPFYLNEATGG